MRDKIQPGPVLAAAVLVAALLALALIDGGTGGGPSSPPLSGNGPALQLLPGGRGDASLAQYGGHRHRGETLQGRPHGKR